MNTKIFNALKQEYARLGLGDEFLQAHAQYLASMGFVTDENMQSVIANQKAYLEGIQSSRDKRVTDAIAKAKKEAEDAAAKAAAAHAAALKEANDKLALSEQQYKDLLGKTTPPTDGIPEWYKAEQEKQAKAAAKREEERKKQMDEQAAANAALKAQIEKMEQEKKAEAEAAAAKLAAEQRLSMITEKAKKLGIPEYRIAEGFNIGADADETAIDTYLAKVSDNIKTNQLPNRGHHSIVSGEEVSKEDAAAVIGAIMR